MSGLSDFLTQGTAPWWGTPIGVLGGAAIAFTSTYYSDKRKKRLELQTAKTKAEREDKQRWDADVRKLCVEFWIMCEDIRRMDLASQREAYKRETAFFSTAPTEVLNSRAEHIIQRMTEMQPLNRLVQGLRFIAPSDLVRAAVNARAMLGELIIIKISTFPDKSMMYHVSFLHTLDLFVKEARRNLSYESD